MPDSRAGPERSGCPECGGRPWVPVRELVPGQARLSVLWPGTSDDARATPLDVHHAGIHRLPRDIHLLEGTWCHRTSRSCGFHLASEWVDAFQRREHLPRSYRRFHPLVPPMVNRSTMVRMPMRVLIGGLMASLAFRWSTAEAATPSSGTITARSRGISLR